MNATSQFKGKRVLVIGLAKSGLAASQLLHRLGAVVTVNDAKPIEENEEAKQLIDKGIRVICGEHPLSLLDEQVDLLVKNPGIPYSNQIVAAAIEKGIPIITEVEIAYLISNANFIAITGSNGKTTTTTLVGEMLRNGRKNPLVAGNIGTAIACEVAETATNEDVIVAELSSFQLQGTIQFRPKIAALLNLFDTHLDYHGTKEAYVSAKARIFANQCEDDYAVVNYDQPEVMAIVKEIKAKIVPFSLESVVAEGSYINDGYVCFQGEQVIKVSEIALPGEHNLENILAAVAVAKLSGASNEQIVHVLKTFTGVRHRLQFVTEKQGRTFYNDSKATNMLASTKAVEAFSQPVVLLAGGLDRGNSFDDFIPALEKVKAVITFGETKQKLVEAAEKAGVKQIHVVKNVEEAVPVAFSFSEVGDVILLSPACASWDQYKSFEIRGDKFIEAIENLN